MPTGVIHQTGGLSAVPGDCYQPPAGMPHGDAVRYWRELIMLGLLLLALPWLLTHLITKPGAVLAGRGPTGGA